MVIAVLAAITIVSYSGITNTTHDTVVRNDLAAFSKKLNIQSINKGRYPEYNNFANLVSLNFKVSQGSYATGRNNFYYCPNADGTEFAVSAISKTGKAIAYTSRGLVSDTSSVGGGDSTCLIIGVTVYAWVAGYIGDTNTWTQWTRQIK